MATTANKNFNTTLNELLIFINGSIIDDENQTEEKKEQFIKESNILNDYITESKKIYNNIYNKIFKTFEDFIKSSLSDTYRSKIYLQSQKVRELTPKQDIININNLKKTIKKTIKKYNKYSLNIDTIESKKINILYKYLEKIININKIINIYKALNLPLLYNLNLLNQNQSGTFDYIWDFADSKTNKNKYIIKCVKCAEMKNKFTDFSRYSRNDNINKCKVCIKIDSKTKRNETIKRKENEKNEKNELNEIYETENIFYGYEE